MANQIERVEESALGNPALLIDQNTGTYLSGWTAKAEQYHACPNAQHCLERYAMRWRGLDVLDGRYLGHAVLFVMSLHAILVLSLQSTPVLWLVGG